MTSFLDYSADEIEEILKRLYAEPKVRPQRPHYDWVNHQVEFFHEHHLTDRWNLRDPLDAFQLYYLIDATGFRSFELALMLSGESQYKKSHYYFGVYDALRWAENSIFPYKEGGASFCLESFYQRVQREAKEMEDT
jgi:hypothetical protein